MKVFAKRFSLMGMAAASILALACTAYAAESVEAGIVREAATVDTAAMAAHSVTAGGLGVQGKEIYSVVVDKQGGGQGKEIAVKTDEKTGKTLYSEDKGKTWRVLDAEKPLDGGCITDGGAAVSITLKPASRIG